MGFGGGNPTILLVGIILFAVTTLFSVITLPVNLMHLHGHLTWLETANITTAAENEKAKDALEMGSINLCCCSIGFHRYAGAIYSDLPEQEQGLMH